MLSLGETPPSDAMHGHTGEPACCTNPSAFVSIIVKNNRPVIIFVFNLVYFISRVDDDNTPPLRGHREPKRKIRKKKDVQARAADRTRDLSQICLGEP